MQAEIFFGSNEATKERKSPYSGEVVSYASRCDEDDTNRALKIA